jgi:hypothetical protein
MLVCHWLPGVRKRRRIEGKSKGLPEREGWRKAKRIVFDTTEATNLLKIKDRVFEKGENELVFKRKLASKCTPESRFLPILVPRDTLMLTMTALPGTPSPACLPMKCIGTAGHPLPQGGEGRRSGACCKQLTGTGH